MSRFAAGQSSRIAAELPVALGAAAVGVDGPVEGEPVDDLRVGQGPNRVRVRGVDVARGEVEAHA